VVTIVLLVQDTGDKKPAPKAGSAATSTFPELGMDRAMAAATNGRARTRPRPDPRLRPVGSILTGAALAKATGELLASCSDSKKATNLFYKANRLRYQDQHRPWAKAAFAALLRCRHALDGQKMWSAFRLAQLHAKDGECRKSTRAWRKWVRYGGLRKNSLLKQPRCARKK
jgi:hypothetical protein